MGDRKRGDRAAHAAAQLDRQRRACLLPSGACCAGRAEATSACRPLDTSKSSHGLMINEEDVGKLASAARLLSPGTSVYLEADFVMNLLETVLDYMLQTEVDAKALQHFRENRCNEVRTLDGDRPAISAHATKKDPAARRRVLACARARRRRQPPRKAATPAPPQRDNGRRPRRRGHALRTTTPPRRVRRSRRPDRRTRTHGRAGLARVPLWPCPPVHRTDGMPRRKVSHGGGVVAAGQSEVEEQSLERRQVRHLERRELVRGVELFDLLLDEAPFG